LCYFSKIVGIKQNYILNLQKNIVKKKISGGDYPTLLRMVDGIYLGKIQNCPKWGASD